MASKTSKLLSVRLHNDITARIDAVSNTLPVLPGIKITRSSTARMLLLEGLKVFETRPVTQPARLAPPTPSSGDEAPLFEGWAD